MRNGAITLTLLLLAACAARAQEPQKDFTDPVALLKAVARTYATGADTFRMESIAEITTNADLRHERRKVDPTAIQGRGNPYRIATRAPSGSFTQDSDGTTEGVYPAQATREAKPPRPET